jgi:hypothetical protein
MEENGFSVLVIGTERSLYRFVVAAVQILNAEIISKAAEIPNGGERCSCP